MRMNLVAFIACLFYFVPAAAQPAADLNFSYGEITLPKLMEKIQKGNKDLVILDVRTRGEYHDTASSGKQLNLGHIKGAVNIPIQELESKPETLAQLAPYRDKDIYVLCSHSYRSRMVSKLLLKNGFSRVINVQGGMSEWFRNYEELKPFRENFYERNIVYNNISPSEIFSKLKKGEEVEFIGFANPPRFFFDTVMTTLYQYFPSFKNAAYFKPADSAQVWEKAVAAKGKPIVLFNTVGSGAAEAAERLAARGISNVNYLVGNLAGFYEYVVNYQKEKDVRTYMVPKSDIRFFTPMSFCREKPSLYQWIDLRHDTLYNKITNGTRLSYKTIRGAGNFPFYKTVEDFTAQFPDKSKQYLFIPQQGYVGLELAGALVKKGYNIGWLIGGIERWEWYTNNVEAFTCRDELIK